MIEDLKNRILSYMREDAYRPLLAEDLAEGMQLTTEDLVQFWAAMEELEHEARIIRNRSDLYGLPERMHLVVGRLSMSAKGFGFIVPDRKDTEGDTDVFVPGPMLGSAMHGDRVVARVAPSDIPGRSREGEILRIVERANKRIVGTFSGSRTFGFVAPDDTRLQQDIFVPKNQFGGARTGMKVVVEITEWPAKRHNAEGRVIEILGKAGDPGVDVLSVMRQYDLSETFPPAVQEAADHVERLPLPEEYRGRKDRRDLRIVTIDGEDAKDLDDGVYAERRADGSFFLGVYIADVSWYVREGQPLDREASRRGTSVYLVDRVIPMLPRELSNGICSLNAGEDRLSMACEMQIGRDGSVMSYEILPVVIHVYRRLSYNLVNKVLVGREQPFLDDNADLLPMLEVLAELRGVLNARRRARGAIDFELPEVKVKLDEKGRPISLVKREGSLAESIIEECMLVANETVAEHMNRKHLPFIYRVHEQPKEEKIEQLNRLLSAFGLFIHRDKGGNIKPMDVQRVLKSVKGRPEEKIISTVALRSMQQARYSEESLGHFGLSARFYTHFTSPIRRYPDLVVHRLLRETFSEGGISMARQEKLRGMLPGIAELSSQRERIAIEAERETVDMKKIEYMAQFVGEEFEGIISGVTAFGIFVELDNGVEGLVHVSTMVNDYYAYVEDEFALVGELSRTRYRLGDEVEVILARTNVESRTLDFVLKDNSAYHAGHTKRGRGTPSVEAPQEDKEKHSKRKRRKKEKLPVEDMIAEPWEAEPAKTRPKSGKFRHSRHYRPAGLAQELNVSLPEKEGAKENKHGRSGRHSSKKKSRAAKLNRAVWPDPPGYHSHSVHPEGERPDRNIKNAKRHPHRKDKGGDRR